MRSWQTKIRMAPVSSPMAARIGGFRKPCSALYFSRRIIARTNAMAPMPVKSFTPTSPSQSKLNHDVRGGGGGGGVKGGGGGGRRTGTSGSASDTAAAIGSEGGISTNGGGPGSQGGSRSRATSGT